MRGQSPHAHGEQAWWGPSPGGRPTHVRSPAMSTAVVTGGAGFLGSHLCEYLLAREWRVICLDNLDTGSLMNVKHLREDRFEFRYHNCVDFIDVDEPVDAVFHLASPASPVDYLRLP